MADYIYPLTIVRDRYAGTYSGAEYLAFKLDYYDVPDAIGGCDSDEMCFFMDGGEHEEYTIGKGNTIQDAYNDLERKLYLKSINQ